MKPFLLLQHRYLDEASDNEYEAVLDYGNLQPNEIVRIRMDQQSIADINPLDYSGIITGADLQTSAILKMKNRTFKSVLSMN